MRQKYSTLYLKILRWGIIAILLIAPFYATLTVWVANSVHHFDFLKIWKEIALTILVIVLTSFLVANRNLARRIIKNRLLLAVGLYIILLIIYGLYDLVTHHVTDKAVIYGLLVDIRPVGFFALTYLTYASSLQRGNNNFPWKKIILLPAAIVIAFGLLQMTILPKDVLTHIGYSKATILPYETVDNQPDIVRVQSTLRGANPFGAYLLVITTLLAAIFLAEQVKHRRWWWGAATLGTLVVLFGTYSRSAEVGLLVSLVVLLLIYEKQLIAKHLAFVLVMAALVGAGGILAARHNNYFAQNIFFHSSSQSTSNVSSNAQRASAIKEGARDLIHHPLGGGVGSAGPASLRNSKGQPKIAENYYIQIGQEIGIIGMLLFIVINVVVGWRLWLRKNSLLARALLASLIGITFVNMVSHAWTDDTLAYIWWGLAGIALAPRPLLKRSKTVSGID